MGNSISEKNKKICSWLWKLVSPLLLLLLVLSDTGWALTPAGTVINNTATATYNDASGNPLTSISNTFSITVSQVAGVSLTPASQTRSGPPGVQMQFPHNLQNTGNGPDTFNLSNTVGGAFSLTSVAVIRDDNGNGIADPGEPAISSILLAMDEIQQLVVVGTIPGTAIPGTSGTVTLNTVSVFNPSVTGSSVDTADATNNAAISLSKSVSSLSVNPGGLLTYTINYTNIGINSTAGVPVVLDSAPVTRHVVRDIIPANTSFTSFLGGTPAGGTQVYHATGAPEDTYVTSQPALFDAVAYLFTTPLSGGASGSFSWSATVNANAQVGSIENTAVMKFNDSASITSVTSNTTVTLVNFIPAVIMRDTDIPADDIQEVASGNAGSVVSFTNQVVNNGNGLDTFNITVAPGNFPVGSTFSLFNADGITILSDTNGDAIPDTGPLDALVAINIVMKVTLPANAKNVGAPFSATVTATSISDATVSDVVTDRLLTIIEAGVDVTNTTALPGAPGAGPGPEGAPVVTGTGNPGALVNFDLHVNNTGVNPDSFNLQFSNIGAGFIPGALPADVTSIQFFLGDGSGSPTGVPITNTGLISGGANIEVIAQVQVSPLAAAGVSNDLFFRAISSTSLVSDIIFDRVTVNTVRGITLQLNQSGQAAPGAAKTYAHVLTNTGNVTEGLINLTATNSQAGFSAVIYNDLNGNGSIDPGDAVVSSVASLAPGAATFLIVRVAVPSSAANGTVDTMTLTATPTGGIAPPAAVSNMDQTTVVVGQIDLTITSVPSGTQPPGTVITYTITYRNLGADVADQLVISDAVPAFTTYVPGTLLLNGVSKTDLIGDDAGEFVPGVPDTVRFIVGTVASGGTGTVSFNVTID